jgi:ribosomal protein L7/L12
MPFSTGVHEAVTAGRKIDAIKLLRAETGMGLKEAKHAVEDLERSLDIQPSAVTNASSFAGLVKLVGLIVAGILMYRYLVA